MLGVVVTETLYRTHPDLSEGRLAKLRAAVVNARALAEVGRGIGLGQHIKLGRGEQSTGGRNKASILSDTVEAVLGAIHLSGGFEVSADVVHQLFDPMIETASSMGAGLDWKTSLQELSAEHGLGVPEYLIEDEGPDHAKTFTAKVRVGDGVYGNGAGPLQEGGRAGRRRDRVRRDRRPARSAGRPCRPAPQPPALTRARAPRGGGGPARPRAARRRCDHHLGRGAPPPAGTA